MLEARRKAAGARRLEVGSWTRVCDCWNVEVNTVARRNDGGSVGDSDCECEAVGVRDEGWMGDAVEEREVRSE
ncbi:hypothetical protein PIB30_062029 [Stylosanthes scabra]|uniref:Uncharacterized protein n=1 Tax=Stylosanthes scabra TaxID=79078 RepID=A0ABU6XMD2_9FABA|nr:hypothetical protein [Stylosanthes scabra]